MRNIFIKYMFAALDKDLVTATISSADYLSVPGILLKYSRVFVGSHTTAAAAASHFAAGRSQKARRQKQTQYNYANN